ncbi:sulfite oxidase [Schinkia azotoformans]|uniref:sulfite oxidase n=1 Tax=Schinkia azotoformans TaxID=1454 RepID=UPI002DBD49AD|nr:sulfite oxidase [Schinkia azotoformans]MEC1715916.1 sulfite oxidase [Schinkia azotoformans]MEC1741555.1 sulfite oxidase [Schinkia azotoformans]MEC1744549.1 sulfite oxidase [Schinkia azotoformans]MEC1758460.1 sulfite oxidase [Schinkia azotoformans]MEC1765262.1 sulfite oxidase [Schinkia azotoformans]
MKNREALPYLTSKRLSPENQESPIHFLYEWLTPIKYFYRRNHFPYPVLTKENFLLSITGEVSHPRFLSYDKLLSMPVKSLLIPLECAGNKRANFMPKVYGEQWEDGAISQGKWTGVPLRNILQKAGVSNDAKEVVFDGADYGTKPTIDESIPFQRSLPIEKAMHPDTIIAYKYNNKPLTFKQGYPLRLIVPNWYAMASVKWLSKITVINHTFAGPFQADDYVYYPHKDSDNDKIPVTLLNVNSTIQKPINLSILNTGTHYIQGMAWTGCGIITEVQIGFDKGEPWHNATLYKFPHENYSWVFWSIQWKVEEKGEYTIFSRAKDSNGRIQPLTAFWNRKGYGFNAVTKVNVKIES